MPLAPPASYASDICHKPISKQTRLKKNAIKKKYQDHTIKQTVKIFIFFKYRAREVKATEINK